MIIIIVAEAGPADAVFVLVAGHGNAVLVLLLGKLHADAPLQDLGNYCTEIEIIIIMIVLKLKLFFYDKLGLALNLFCTRFRLELSSSCARLVRWWT